MAKEMKTIRVLEVERCHPHHCPWCTADSYNKDVNYCEGVSGLRIRAVKTFPKCCPLKKKSNGNGDSEPKPKQAPFQLSSYEKGLLENVRKAYCYKATRDVTRRSSASVRSSGRYADIVSLIDKILGI